MATNSNEAKALTTVIKASEWARGYKRPDHNSLLNKDGSMCCLGIDAAARSISQDELLGVEYPSCIPDLPPELASWTEVEPGLQALGNMDIDLESMAAEINDDRTTTDDEKIAKLRKVFAAVNPPRRIVWLPNQ